MIDHDFAIEVTKLLPLKTDYHLSFFNVSLYLLLVRPVSFWLHLKDEVSNLRLFQYNVNTMNDLSM